MTYNMSKIEVKLNPDVPPTGDDLAIVNAARRSFGTRSDWEYDTNVDPYGDGSAEFKLKDKDKRLIEFLARGMTAYDFEYFTEEVQRLGYNAFNQQGTDIEGLDLGLLVDELWQWRNTPTHDTPFNHGFISFEVKAPIFVRAQLVKHEYLIMSEFSRRYITDEIEFFEPSGWRMKADNKKQGSSDELVGDYESLWEFDSLSADVYSQNKDSLDLYNHLVKQGLCPEQARMVLPQSLMTSWTWSGTLGAFAKMCTLRIHPEAQKEAKIVADAVYKELKKVWPVGAPALVEGV